MEQQPPFDVQAFKLPGQDKQKVSEDEKLRINKCWAALKQYTSGLPQDATIIPPEPADTAFHLDWATYVTMLMRSQDSTEWLADLQEQVNRLCCQSWTCDSLQACCAHLHVAGNC